MNQYIEEIIRNYNFFKEKDIISLRLFENQGVCNTTYLLDTANYKFIVKKINKALHVDKKTEYTIQLKASKKGISSQPIITDIENQISVCKYLAGYHKKILSKSDLKKLAKTLYRLHEIKLKAKVFNIENFFIKNSKRIDVKQKYALLKLKKYKKDLVLCHNDLNSNNILFSNSVKFIDWEFSSINDRYFDLASIISEFNLNKRMESYFLRCYYKSKKHNKEKLKIYKILYKHLCKIWYDKQKRRQKCHEQF